MKIRCLIVDDEPLAQEGMAGYVQQLDFLELVGSAAHPLEALPLLKQHQPDLLLLDIEMPKLNGLDFIRSLHQPPLIVLTTAYPSYALEGFELEVLDYLVKPITFERFLKTALRVQRRCQENQPLSPTAPAPVAAPTQENKDFFIKADGKLERITLAELQYVEAMQNYIHLYTGRGRFTTLLSLRDLEAAVGHPDLLRVHKSYLANLRRVATIEGRQLVIGEARVPVSRFRWEKVEKRLLGGHLLG
jgi:DNA-binding LytR/AlgR family response regulator